MGPSESDILAEIARAETALDARALRLWESVRIPPSTWRQSTYSDVGTVWVVGLLGARCLCFNPVEEGWGWAPFDPPGVITQLHFEELELHHAIVQVLAAIDLGGGG